MLDRKFFFKRFIAQQGYNTKATSKLNTDILKMIVNSSLIKKEGSVA